MINCAVNPKNNKFKNKLYWTKQLDAILQQINKTLKLDHDCFFDLSFVSKKRIMLINAKYRKKPKYTDVISIAFMDDKQENKFASGLLGEIFLCYPIIKLNAKQKNVIIENEITLVIVHSLLHLFGYNHENQKDFERMEKLTKIIIDSLPKEQEL